MPGFSQMIGIAPVPSGAYALTILYWTGYNPGDVPQADLATYLLQPIPHIPSSFHYTVLIALQARAFLFLYGKGDSRYETLRIELEGRDGMGGLLGDLDRWNHPGVQGYDTWISHDHSDHVRSDRV